LSSWPSQVDVSFASTRVEQIDHCAALHCPDSPEQLTQVSKHNPVLGNIPRSPFLMGVFIKGRTRSLFFRQARHDRHLDVVAATLPSKK
jgi:hypothetical protein